MLLSALVLAAAPADRARYSKGLSGRAAPVQIAASSVAELIMPVPRRAKAAAYKARTRSRAVSPYRGRLQGEESPRPRLLPQSADDELQWPRADAPIPRLTVQPLGEDATGAWRAGRGAHGRRLPRQHTDRPADSGPLGPRPERHRIAPRFQRRDAVLPLGARGSGQQIGRTWRGLEGLALPALAHRCAAGETGTASAAIRPPRP
jgi:hypothetical protein